MKNVFKILIASLLIISFSYFIYLLSDLGFLSNKYLLIGCLFLVIIMFIIIAGLFKFKNKILKILLGIICFMLSIINCAGIYYLNSTLSFIDNIGNNKE